MSLASISRLESKLLLPTYERQPILFVRGRGVYLWDSRGKRYLDFLSGIGVNALPPPCTTATWCPSWASCTTAFAHF